MKGMATLLKFSLLILLSIVIIGLVACQPTPEKPTIINKDTDLVETVIEANTEENLEELEEDKQVIEEQIKKVNGHIEMEIIPSDMVTIKVDADVISTGLDKIPVVRVQPKNFSKEQFEAFIGYLTNGEPVYYEDFAEGYFSYSKEEVESMLPVLNKYTANEGIPNNVKNHLESRIADLKENYNIAINKSDERLYDGTLTKQENNSTFNYITSLKCYLGKENAARLSLWQSINETESQMQFSNNNFGAPYNTFEPYEGVDAQRMNMTYEEAKTIVKELVRVIDGEVSNMVIYESSIGYSVGSFANYTKETSSQAYSFSLARQYNGVEIKPVMYLFDGEENINYSKRVSPESIRVVIDDNGIDMAFWINYTEYIETLAEDAPLLDFDSINEIFEDYCRYKFTWTYRNDALVGDTTPDVTLNVKRIELNMMVIPEKDNLESYITVPVWDFIADMEYDEEVTTQDGYPAVAEQNVSILTINAIDGSVIDREQGY